MPVMRHLQPTREKRTLKFKKLACCEEREREERERGREGGGKERERESGVSNKVLFIVPETF